MDNILLESSLLKGNNIIFQTESGKEVVLKNFSLREIYDDLRIDRFNMALSYMTTEQDVEKMILFFSLFIECDHVYFNREFEEYVFYMNEANELISLNKNDHNKIINVFKQMYLIIDKKEKNQKVVAQDKKTQMLYEELMEFGLKNKQERSVTMNSIIESISCRHPSYNLFNIWGLTIYQLMRTHARMKYSDNYDQVMRAVYAGTISLKKDELQDIDWAKTVK